MNFIFARVYTALIFILIKVAAGMVPEEFEGNIYIANQKDEPSHTGVLKVYSQEKWNLVCYSMNGKVVMNNAAAATACRQTGYLAVADGGLQSTECKGDLEVKQCAPQKAISGIQCPEVANYSSTGEIFLLRCNSQEETVNKTKCDDFAKVTCDPNRPDPYNGQIEISKENDDLRNVLVIYLEEQPRPVCIHKPIARQAAHSACRQLGFTNSTFDLFSRNSIPSWKINDASLCGTKSNNISFSCFTDCINKTAGYVPVESCDEEYSLFHIFCEFNKGDDGVYSAGNEIICTYHDTSNQTECYDPSGVIAATVVLSLATFILICLVIVLAIILAVACKKLRGRRRQHQHEGQHLLPQYGGVGGGGGGDDHNDNRDGGGDNEDNINH